MVLWWFVGGMALGVAVAAGVAAWAFRRQVARLHAAERRARAAERMAEIGAMTGGLAHEIKNPLSTIGLNVQLLLEAVDDVPLGADEKSRLVTRLKGLRREVERLRGILEDFLEFAGQVHVDARPCDLNTLVGELVDFYHPEAERLGVRVRAQLPDHAIAVRADPKLLKQAVLNLMINATQAMAGARGGGSRGGGGGGELMLRTEDARDPDGARVARLHVIDTGPGIAGDLLGRVFQPYFTTKSGGSGLGLPTARRLVEAHGGRIEVHTEAGRGTDFTVVLPRDVDAG